MSTSPPINTITAQELGRRLDVHDKTVRRWCQQGVIPSHCYSKGSERSHYRFFEDAVEHWMDHGEWPSRTELARRRRARRESALGIWNRAGLLVSMRIADLVEQLEEHEDAQILYKALALETERRNRKGALAALRERIAEIEGWSSSAA